MSNPSEPDFDLDFHFLPAWAQKNPEEQKFTRHGDDKDSGPTNKFREKPARQREHRHGGRPDRSNRQESTRKPPKKGGPRNRRGEFPKDRSGPPRREQPPEPLPNISVQFIPEEKGVESLARQIKITGRAYPLFDIARLILKKPERYDVRFEVVQDKKGEAQQPLFQCPIDQSLWLTDSEAVQHLLKKHFDVFYKTEQTPTDPPKGNFTCVAQCGMSGVILGPPNYHGYQAALKRLHQERFSRVPFDAYKSRVKILHDTEMVKKWQEDHSVKTEYIPVDQPDAARLQNLEEAEIDFRQNYLSKHVLPVNSAVLNASLFHQQSRPPVSHSLRRLYQRTQEEQQRFPLKMVNVLSQQFAKHSLQFFKVNKTITHVAVSRPHYLDLNTTPVSTGVRAIIKYINEYPRCTRRQLIEALAPGALLPSPEQKSSSSTVPTSPSQPPETQHLQESSESKSPSEPPPPEVTAIISDLHWLIHQGHVIEFANGVLETAKPPAQKQSAPANKQVSSSNVPSEIQRKESTQAPQTDSEKSTYSNENPSRATTPEDQSDNPSSQPSQTLPQP